MYRAATCPLGRSAVSQGRTEPRLPLAGLQAGWGDQWVRTMSIKSDYQRDTPPGPRSATRASLTCTVPACGGVDDATIPAHCAQIYAVAPTRGGSSRVRRPRVIVSLVSQPAKVYSILFYATGRYAQPLASQPPGPRAPPPLAAPWAPGAGERGVSGSHLSLKRRAHDRELLVGARDFFAVDDFLGTFLVAPSGDKAHRVRHGLDARAARCLVLAERRRIAESVGRRCLGSKAADRPRVLQRERGAFAGRAQRVGCVAEECDARRGACPRLGEVARLQLALDDDWRRVDGLPQRRIELLWQRGCEACARLLGARRVASDGVADDRPARALPDTGGHHEPGAAGVVLEIVGLGRQQPPARRARTVARQHHSGSDLVAIIKAQPHALLLLGHLHERLGRAQLGDALLFDATPQHLAHGVPQIDTAQHAGCALHVEVVATFQGAEVELGDRRTCVE
eukprot:scaffold3056_cov70-Phaeocystis_antarctica.AAC.2